MVSGAEIGCHVTVLPNSTVQICGTDLQDAIKSQNGHPVANKDCTQRERERREEIKNKN